MNSKPIRLSIIGVCALVGVALHSSAIAQCNPQEVTKLLASDGAASDWFGSSVSISGDVAILGAPNDDDGERDSGSAYIFKKVAGVWTQKAKLTASDGAIHHAFGFSVSLSGDAAIVGTPYYPNIEDRSGAAYVFENVGGIWTEVAKLRASDWAIDDYFGASVSISGEIALVSAYGDDSFRGSAYVFEKVAGVWTQVAKLRASDGGAFDNFGSSVSISGEIAIVGASGDNSYRGSAYVFEKIAGVWTQVAKLNASDGSQDDTFGFFVSVSGETAIVGASADDDRGSSSGSAYVFERTGGVWRQVAKLLASDGAEADYFGSSLSVGHGIAVVGAPFHDDLGVSSGSAYVFRKVGNIWTEIAKLTASDGADGDNFGSSVSLSGDTAILGAHDDDDLGSNSGSAYVFDLNCGPQLSVNASCPSGGPIQVSWSGATSGGTVVLLYARNTGSFRIPNGNACAGTALGLGSNQLQIGYQGAAGQNGSRTVNANAGAGVCGGYLQLLDVATCGTSNVVRVE